MFFMKYKINQSYTVHGDLINTAANQMWYDLTGKGEINMAQFFWVLLLLYKVVDTKEKFEEGGIVKKTKKTKKKTAALFVWYS